jgi:osmotically-inducible protein OsmY
METLVKIQIAALLAAALGFVAVLQVSAQQLDTPSTTPARGSSLPADVQGDGSQRALDLATTTRVKAALQLDAELKTQNIVVETLDGRVRFTGQVSSAANFDRVKDVVWRLEGVKSVDNQLVVRDVVKPL